MLVPRLVGTLLFGEMNSDKTRDTEFVLSYVVGSGAAAVKSIRRDQAKVDTGMRNAKRNFFIP